MTAPECDSVLDSSRYCLCLRLTRSSRSSMTANRSLTRATSCIVDGQHPSSPRSLLDCSLAARRPAELVETAFFNIEKHPQVIQLPLRLDGLARQLVKLVYIKWLL